MGFFGKTKYEKISEANEALKRYSDIQFLTVENLSNIKTYLNIVNGFSDSHSYKTEEFELLELEARLEILKNAKSLGANAIIGVKLNPISFQAGGSQWMMTSLSYTGTAVILN